MVVLGVSVLGVFFVLGLAPLTHPRIAMNHRRAVKSLQEMNAAEQNYGARRPGGGFACSIAQLAHRNSGLSSGPGSIDPVLASGTKAGYRFEIRCPGADGSRFTAYTITAVPIEPGVTGRFALCTDQHGEVWYSSNGSPSDCLAMRKPAEGNVR